MKKIIFTLLLTTIYLSLVVSVQAEYMLPYPSYMPGNKIYKISRIIDSVKAYWYFGDIAQVKYHLMLSDKYLVEAKTLFEYKQYLLASDALKRSYDQFSSIPESLYTAKAKNIDTSAFETLLVDSASKHIEVLNGISSQVPEQFVWTPEKDEATNLDLKQYIETSKLLRSEVLQKFIE